MDCIAIILTDGRSIECEHIEPNEDLPGFFNVCKGNNKWRIYKADMIAEVVPNKWFKDEIFD